MSKHTGRSDALEKRRKLMEAWAANCEPWASANVVQIRKHKPLLSNTYTSARSLKLAAFSNVGMREGLAWFWQVP
jgi:hypothetical protein